MCLLKTARNFTLRILGGNFPDSRVQRGTARWFIVGGNNTHLLGIPAVKGGVGEKLPYKQVPLLYSEDTAKLNCGYGWQLPFNKLKECCVVFPLGGSIHATQNRSGWAKTNASANAPSMYNGLIHAMLDLSWPTPHTKREPAPSFYVRLSPAIDTVCSRELSRTLNEEKMTPLYLVGAGLTEL